MGSCFLSDGNEKENIAKIKSFLCVMDSLSNDELDGKAFLTPSRIIEIAKGSGKSLQTVRELIELHKKVSEQLEEFGGRNLGKENEIVSKERP